MKKGKLVTELSATWRGSNADVFAVDEDANQTFKVIRVEENGEGIWIMLEREDGD